MDSTTAMTYEEAQKTLEIVTPYKNETWNDRAEELLMISEVFPSLAWALAITWRQEVKMSDFEHPGRDLLQQVEELIGEAVWNADG